MLLAWIPYPPWYCAWLEAGPSVCDQLLLSAPASGQGEHSGTQKLRDTSNHGAPKRCHSFCSGSPNQGMKQFCLSFPLLAAWWTRAWYSLCIPSSHGLANGGMLQLWLDESWGWGPQKGCSSSLPCPANRSMSQLFSFTPQAAPRAGQEHVRALFCFRYWAVSGFLSHDQEQWGMPTPESKKGREEFYRATEKPLTMRGDLKWVAPCVRRVLKAGSPSVWLGLEFL